MYIYILKYFVPGWNIVYFIVAEVFDKINNQTLFFFFFFLQGRPDGSSCQTSSSSPDTFRSFGRTHSHCTLLDELQLIKEILQPSPNTLIGAGGGEDTVRE